MNVTITAPATYSCPDAPYYDPPPVFTLRWSAPGATSASVAIDNPTGTYMDGLPPNGQLELTAPCKPESRTYYVTAVHPNGSTTTASHTVVGN